VELANIVLRHCPTGWQDQYNLNQDTIPQDSWKLLLVLENIKKLNPGSTIPMKLLANNNNPGGTKANAKSDMTSKQKSTDSSSGRIPKKKRSKKHCILCKDKGGRHDTHNTNECAKWEKDGSLKASWVEKDNLTDKKKSESRSFAQLLNRFSKLEKSIKKGKKSASWKKKCCYDTNSSSNSE
jgi:hypothetical protein